jgi:hypothetical protein
VGECISVAEAVGVKRSEFTRRLRTDERDPFRRPGLWLPGYLDTDVLLAASDDAAVTMHGIACYPAGFAFTLETVTRYEIEGPSEETEGGEWPFDAWWTDQPATAHLRIEYGNGSRGVLEAWSEPLKKVNTDIAITLGGGGGRAGHHAHEIWVQPLPPPGPAAFICAWEPVGIPETRHEIGGELFRAAAARAKRIFPDSAASGPGSGTS